MPFDEATPAVHFPKAFIRGLNTAGIASTYLGPCVSARACVCGGVYACVYKCLELPDLGLQGRQTLPTLETCNQVLDGASHETVRHSEVV